MEFLFCLCQWSALRKGLMTSQPTANCNALFEPTVSALDSSSEYVGLRKARAVLLSKQESWFGKEPYGNFVDFRSIPVNWYPMVAVWV